MRRILILGAAGRDFHNFNVAFRDDPRVRVVAFTAAQIPNIAGRRYPPDLAGPNADALRVLLYLFGRDAAVRLLRAE